MYLLTICVWVFVQSKGASAVVDKDDQQTAGSQHTEPLTEASRRLQSIQAGRILALDQAVHFSIDCTCESLAADLPAFVRPDAKETLCSILPVNN